MISKQKLANPHSLLGRDPFGSQFKAPGFVGS
jgi:hypothetical protein